MIRKVHEHKMQGFSSKIDRTNKIVILLEVSLKCFPESCQHTRICVFIGWGGDKELDSPSQA